MADIKSAGQLWSAVSKMVDASPNGKLTNAQIAEIFERSGQEVPKVNGRPIKNITGFDLGAWEAAGERARVVYGMPYPKPTWNPIKWQWERAVWLKSKITGYPTAPVSIPDPWARHEAWRYSGPFKPQKLRWQGTFPGLGVATGAFAVYLAYDLLLAPKEEHH